MIGGLAARAAATAGLAPGQVTFTAVLSLARAAITADNCCPHCHKHPASANAPLAGLDTAILALPPGRTGRQRTSGRTTAERQTWTSEPAEHTLTIVPSNLPKQTYVSEVKGSGPAAGVFSKPVPAGGDRGGAPVARAGQDCWG
jgi:hypothetical protein